MSSKKGKKQKKQKNVGSESQPESTTKNVESESSLPKITQKVSKKRKNESEIESSPGKTAQKTSQEQAAQIASQKRKKIENESESSSATKRRSERIASQDSDLASVIRDLRLSFTFSSSYGIEDLPSSASLFKTKDMEALRVNFCEALAENDVIPDVEGMSYIVPAILSVTLIFII